MSGTVLPRPKLHGLTDAGVRMPAFMTRKDELNRYFFYLVDMGTGGRPANNDDAVGRQVIYPDADSI